MVKPRYGANYKQNSAVCAIGVTGIRNTPSTKKEYWCTLTIAGISFRINSSDKKFLELASNAYNHFLSKNTPDLIIDVEIEESLIALKEPGASIQYKDDFLIACREDFYTHVDFSQGRAEITQRRTIYSLDALLRLLVAIKLVDAGGFLLHGASVIKDGKGYIFFGPSGSGKSTIASLSKNYMILGDEQTAIRNVDGKYMLFSTPFWGSTPGKTIRANGSLDGIYRIFHGLENRCERLDIVPAFSTLLPEIVRFDGHKTLIEKITDNLANLLEKVEFYNLYFLPNKSFWEVIT